MELAVTDFMKVGQISWDHMHKDEVRSRPRYIVGEPLDVRFSDGDRNATLVKAQLYPKNKIAQDLMDNLKSETTRLGASIGGKKLSKSFSGRIDKIWWDEVAITYKPVNSTTIGNVTLTPMEEFAKSLTAGAGVNPAEFTSGRAMTAERGKPFANLSDDLRQKFENSIGWSLSDAVYETVRKQYRDAFVVALKFIQDTPDYDDDALISHLIGKKYSKAMAEVVCVYLKQNMNKALHVLR